MSQIFGAIDTPSIDHVIPNWDIIKDRMKDPEKLKKAEVIYDEIISSLGKRNIPGSKFTLDEQTAGKCKGLLLELEKIFAGTDIKIQTAGGTGYRKLFYTKLILQEQAEAKLFGATGNDKEGDKLKNIIAKNNIELVDNGESLLHTREALLITPKNSKDRIGAKFPYTEARFFHDEKKLLEYAKSCDCFYLESSLIKFLGKENFINFCRDLSANNVKIIFAPPTDRSFFIDIKTGAPLTENIAAFRAAAKYASIITMNELEAIWFIGDINFYKKITGRNDPNLAKAVNAIKKLLKGYDNKMVLITVGEHGMIGITKDLIIERDALKIEKIINTVGAGDSAAAAVTSVLCRCNDIFTKESAEKALQKACEISSYVIQNQPAAN